MRLGVLKHCRAEAVLEAVIFQRQNGMLGPENALQHRAVEGLTETGVDDFDINAMIAELGRGEQGAFD